MSALNYTPILTSAQFSLLDSLASTARVSHQFSAGSGYCQSDVYGWLAYAVSDVNQSAPMKVLRETIRVAIGANITPGAKELFDYYAGLLNGDFPRTVVPAVWLDGRRQAFSDSAGLVPVSSGLIRRINEASPLTGVWNAESDADRPLRDSSAIRCELNSGDGGAAMVRGVASGLNANACTLVVSWVHRGMAHGGPQQGLFTEFNVGLALGGDQIWVLTPSGLVFSTGLFAVQGVRNTCLVSYSATGFDLVLNAGGAVTTTTISMAINSTVLTSAWTVGHFGTAGYSYASFTQALAVARTIAAGSERDTLIAWAHAQPGDPAFGTDRALIAGIGDSITAGTAATPGAIYIYQAEQSARALGNLAEVCNTALGGQGVPNILQPGSVLMKSDAFYSSARAKNIAVIFLGTNDAAGGNPVQYIVNGVGAAGGAGLYQAGDYLRGRGWKVIFVTMLPRTDPPAVAAGCEAIRVALNAELLANGHLHADIVVDVTGLVIGAPAASDNTSFYSTDKIHLINAGHTVLASVVTPAILSLL